LRSGIGDRGQGGGDRVEGRVGVAKGKKLSSFKENKKSSWRLIKMTNVSAKSPVITRSFPTFVRIVLIIKKPVSRKMKQEEKTVIFN
jgi:hypothetical protein